MPFAFSIYHIRGYSLQITSIYAPIKDDLAKVEESIKAVSQVDIPHMAELLAYVLTGEAKRVRPALTLLAGKLYHYHPHLLIPTATAIELVHTATLLHDDVIDDSHMRRGIPTVNSLRGDTAAVLLGDYLFSAAGRMISDVGNGRVESLLSKTVMKITSGELEETFSAYDLRQTREQYYHQIGNKTASLFFMAAQSGAILGQAPEKEVEILRIYGYNLGMSFQIVDDILDFTSQEDVIGKPVGADLAQGILTLPAILFLEQHPEDNPIKKFFERKDGTRLRPVVDMLSKSPIISQCYNIASDFCKRACQALENISPSTIRTSLMEMAKYVVERER
jgi:octaprenyl-diphosphate synthase